MICHMYMIHTLQTFVNAFPKKRNITERLTFNAQNIPINTNYLTITTRLFMLCKNLLK